MKRLALALAFALTVALPSLASASTFTFLQFNQITFNQPFVITNPTPTSTHMSASTNVNVTFDPSFCLVVGCGGVTNGTFLLTFTADSTSAASFVNAGADINQTFGGSISFTQGAVNLLTVLFSDLVAGSTGGGSPTLASAQPPDVFTGSSTVLDPAKLGVPRGFSLSFSNWAGGLQMNGVNPTIAASFADATGTFAASTAVPEPASLVLLGIGLAGLAVKLRKKAA